MRRIREGNAAGSNYFHAGLHTQIIHVPDYGATGRIRRFVTSPLFSEIQLDLSWKRGPLEESNFFSRVVYLGYIHQNINNNGRGYSLMLGLGSAFSMYKKKEGTTNLPCTFKGRDLSALDLEKPRDFGDKLSAVHIAGPVLDWTRIRAGYKARLVLDGYLDFGMVNALAFNRYSRSCDISGVKTPLLVNGYYYGFGVTTSSRLNIDIGNFGVEGYLRFQSYGSIDGRDRFQDDVTDDFHLSDSMRVWRIGAVYRIPECPLSLLAGYEGIIRKGIIKNIRESRRELRGFLGLSFVY